MDIRTITKEQAWDIRHQVMWPEKELDFVKLADDALGLHYGLYVEEKLVSVVSLFIDKGQAQFRKFATLQEEQGKGYGSSLLTKVFRDARDQGVSRIWCNARESKASFYDRFGLKPTDQVFQKEGITYVIMEADLSYSIEL